MASEKDTDCITRREALATIALGSAALLTGCAGAQQAAPGASHPDAASGEKVMTNQTALAGNHQIVPLPFAAASLNGISEKMISSHHENNYSGAVKNLNRAEQELSQINADTPPFIVSALRDKELNFRNSKALHEAYFKNLGGDGKRSGAIDTALGQAYGTTARWEQQFKSTALGLGGGSGWAILAFELDTGALRTVASSNHTQVLAFSAPLLVLDLYEHSYQIDYAAAVAKYFDAFFANVNWDEVNRRFERAQRLAAVLEKAA